jgi:hypothetical protein
MGIAKKGYPAPRYQEQLCRNVASATQSLMPYHAGYLSMGQYVEGDVLLASVALDDLTAPKTRPVVVIRTEEPGRIHICPVSSKPPSDAPSLPLSIDDFVTGGLDLFGESYVMTSRVLSLRSGAVIGKKGRLTTESFAEITSRVPAALLTGPETGRNPARSRKVR